MQSIKSISEFIPSKIKVDKYWNFSSEKELKMHRIHSYPAKFPHFLIPKAVNFLKDKGATINQISDIFCGCGTSALEAAKLNYDFWGCDINPVATLIAETKSNSYNKKSLNSFYSKISKAYQEENSLTPNKIYNHERLNYWYDKETISKLHRLLKVIKFYTPNGKYRLFFLTAFSNILKSCSYWLTKSIKPQIDPNKIPQEPSIAFRSQVDYMIKSNNELIEKHNLRNKTKIINANFLNLGIDEPFADLIITSPPYVTSYEYADLHQLSSVWLGFVDDYRDLRKGTIGSLHNSINAEDINRINEIGQDVVINLKNKDKSKAKSVLNYFIDLKQTVVQTKKVLNKDGYAFFVIGDTSYKNVKIENAKFLIKCLFDRGFSDIQVAKRQISKKILTPYRDKKGRFTNNSRGRKVYNSEYIILAKN
jgi:methylase of polypeptide subunit release factors